MTPKELIEREEERFLKYETDGETSVAIREMRNACLMEIEIAKKGVPKNSQAEAVLEVLIQQIMNGRTAE